MPAQTASRGAALVLAIAALVGAPLAASSAAATEGSVPSEVAAYAADPDGLLARLDDLFGVGASGKGLDFGDDTKVGELDRVFVWTDDFLAGVSTSSATKRVNEWTAAITIAEKPVGVATIWINPTGDVPDLADFVEGASLGAAFTGIPVDATLVHDTAHSAWFTLAGTALAPLDPGTSGVASPTTLAAYQKSLVAEAAPAVETPTNQGAINSIIVVVVALIVVAALVVLTGRHSRRTADAAAQATPEPVTPAALAKTVISAPKTPNPAATKAPAKKPNPKRSAPAPKPPVQSVPAGKPLAKKPAAN